MITTREWWLYYSGILFGTATTTWIGWGRSVAIVVCMAAARWVVGWAFDAWERRRGARR